MSEKRLLIVDHDAFQRHLVTMLLAADHYSIQETESAAEALNQLKDLTPDLILAEASLSDMPGTDLCRRIKSIRRLYRVPVVLIASPSEIKTIKELAPVVGADLVLEKPLGDKGLREHIHQLLANTDNKSQIDIYKTFVPEMSSSSETPKAEAEPKPSPVLKPVAEKISTEQKVFKPNPSQAKITATEPPKPGPKYPSINLIPGFIGKTNKAKVEAKQEPKKLEPRVSTFETVAISKDKSAPSVKQDSASAMASKGVQPKPVAATETENPLIRPVAENPHPKPQALKEKAKEPRFNPADLLPPIKPKPASSSSSQMTELALLKKQVEQLIEENEQLKDAIREFKSGVPIVSSQSYLNAVEELEALRRLTEQQAKQLETYLGKSPDEQALTFETKKQKNNDPEKTVWNRIVKGI